MQEDSIRAFCLFGFFFYLNGAWPWLVSLTTPVLTQLFPAKIVAGGKKRSISDVTLNL